MAYQSLYRKYRPQRFGELVGQDHVTTALRNAVRDDRVGHAYLFSGPRGTGKTTTARILAKALNCLNRGADGDPCGVCDHCESIAKGTFLDLFELDAASNRGIDDARELSASLALRSATGGKKLYILDEVHMLTPQASNALLKNLEEPPDHVVFVLATTNPEQVLPTIRSRAQHFEFTLLPTEQIAEYLAEICEREGIEADPEALAVVARGGAGSMRDALSLLDQALAHSTGRLDATEVVSLLGGAPFELRSKILRAIADGDAATVLVELGALLDSGHEPRRVAEDLLRAARDAFLITAAGERVAVDGTDEERATLAEIGTALGTPTVVRVVETLGQAIVDMRGVDAADPRLVLEVALVRLSRRDAGPPLVLLAERVDRLEQALAGGAPASVAAPSPAPPAAEPSAPAPSETSSAPRTASDAAPKRALGAVRTERAARAAESEPEPETAPEPEPEPDAAASPPREPAAAPVPFDLDDVVLAWSKVLPELPMATRSQVQHAQPIEVDGDVVVFGVAPRAQQAVEERFRLARDSIREALTAALGRTPRFKLVPSDAVDLAGAPRSPAASDPTEDVPAPIDEEPPEDLEPADFMDAEPAGPAVSSVGLLEAEFGATVVEELPRQ